MSINNSFFSLRFPRLAVLAGFFVLFYLTYARADVAAPPPIVARIATADVIVVGKVLGLEPRDRMALPYPTSKNKIAYRIAVLRVSEYVLGAKKGNIIKVGFRAPPPPPKPGQPIIPRRGYFVRLKTDAEGMLFLRKHHDGPFFTAEGYFDFVSSANKKHFDQQLKAVKETAKAAADPIKAMKSKDPQQRLNGAGYLLTKYRRRPPGRNVAMKPIPAMESKLILLTLANANWKGPHRFTPYGLPLTPMYLFSQLGVGRAQGFEIPRGVRRPNLYQETAQKWLREHANTYRIQGFVIGGKVKKN